LVAIPFAIITLWCLWFFRDPDRHFEGHENEVVCPADGRIIAIKEVDYPYLIEGRAKRVSIYMNLFNVHVNRFPLSGKVIDTNYFKGSFLGAFEEKSSLENEQMGILIDHNEQKILFVQIAGLIARRIVCRAEKGDELERGQRFGLIRFGSRMDVYLPLESQIIVKIDQNVYAGQTKLGEI
jgi:phosphatidylserine decarboxylase